MRTYGLIGNPLTHSFSETYFKERFRLHQLNDAVYRLFPLDRIEDLIPLISSEHLHGFNVTIPYKKMIFPLLHEIDDVARDAGAVNCVKVFGERENIFLKGYNTDVAGFEKLILETPANDSMKALILGNGGSAVAVAYVLKKMCIPFSFVSRNIRTPNEILFQELNESIIHEHPLIINCTPLGMFPHVEAFPDIPYQGITDKHICIDLIYNPAKTKFLEKCESCGAALYSGMTMLIEQAEKSWEIWNSDIK
jgi:shikimate dehydrogenase